MPDQNSFLQLSIDELFLDPKNPRLGRGIAKPDLPQAEILECMRDWSLEELAVSFLENGYWLQEPLIIVKEELYGAIRNVVVEGNRRLAALKLLQQCFAGQSISRKWSDIVSGKANPESLFSILPCIVVRARDEVEAFLGFRHVTGIKEWKPAEKAEYIAKMIEHNGLSYQEVMRKIGSKTATVRRNYIAYRVLMQMEDIEDISIPHVEDKFSVLFLSLRAKGIQEYLGVNINAEPDEAKKPVPQDKIPKLINFASWLFGTEEKLPLVSDSRKVDSFAEALESPEAVSYLESDESPRLEVAITLAGGEERETIRSVENAALNLELALSRAHLYKDSPKLIKAVKRLFQDVKQLVPSFADISSSIFENK